jgi:hypothetical protein
LLIWVCDVQNEKIWKNNEPVGMQHTKKGPAGDEIRKRPEAGFPGSPKSL